jgi:hypothetical protein
MLVTMESAVMWDVTPCSPVEFYRRFWRTSVNFNQNTRRHVSKGNTIQLWISLQANAATIYRLGSQAPPSESFPIHHPAIIPSFSVPYLGYWQRREVLS